MSGSPQASIDTDYYRIGLYKTFRRAVPAGSDYFEKQREFFTQLFESRKSEVDAILEAEMGRADNSLEEFQVDTFEGRENACELVSNEILEPNEQNQEMHAIHVGLSVITSKPFAPEDRICLMEQLFTLFNTKEETP
jgi:hypothetical protein